MIQLWYIGTVCDDGFDFADAKVACKEFGSHAKSIYAYGGLTRSELGQQQVTPIHMDDVA